MKRKFKSVSIVVPVYNEQKTILKILERVRKSNTLGLVKEIIVVNDGSSDNTKEILDSHRYKYVRVFHQERNQGKGSALRVGFAQASGDVILVQDADLEYNPKDYPILLKPIIDGVTKVVYGSRMIGKGRVKHGGWFFYIGGLGINLLTNILYGLTLTDEATGYKVFEARTLRAIPLVCKRFDFCPEITAKLAKKNIPIYEVSISYKGRKVAQGKKINWIDGFHAVWTLLKYRIID
jgi:dolichol-phosphate mannosyltransferase